MSSSFHSFLEAKQALTDALERVDNKTAAARALGRVVRRFEPAAPTSMDAFRHAAARALDPFFGGNGKPLAWALVDGVNASREFTDGASEGSANSANIEWGDPIPLGPDTPEPYPVDALPDWLAQHVRSVARTTQTPTDLPLMVGLSALSVGTANKARVVVKAGYQVPAHLWTATVLPPASRKSPVFRHMTRPIFEYEEELADRTAPERQRAADERDVVEKALADAKKEAAEAAGSEKAEEVRQRMHELRERLENIDVPGEPRLVASDVTSEKLARLMADNHGRIAILAPEGDLFRIMAGRYSSGVNFDHYKRAWTGDEPIRDDRIGREGSHVRRPAVTMGLTLQPSVLDTLEAKESFRGEGLLGRFLYAVPDSGIGHRRTGEDVSELDRRAARRYRDHLRRLLDAGPKNVGEDGEYVPHELTLSPDAREVWDSFAGEVEGMLGPGGRMEYIPDWGGKLVGQVFRIAVLLQAAHRVGEGVEPWGSELSGHAMRSAVQLGRAAIPHALQVFDALETDPNLRLARYLLRRIRGFTSDADDSPTKRDLFEKVKGKVGLGTVEELNRVLKILEAHHLVRVVPRITDGPGQNPSSWIRLNPKATTDIRTIRRNPPQEGESPYSANVECSGEPESGGSAEAGPSDGGEADVVEVEL